MLNEKIFREYDIRGVADRDLPHNVVSKLGRAIGSYVKRKGGKTLTVGRDCRISSDRIRQSLIDGLLATGINVIDIGLVPTPLLYFSVFELNSDGGIMITGSHNPPEHNGFKICVGKTTIHGEEIQYLKQIVQKDSYESGKGTLSEKDIKPLYTSMILKNIKHPLNL
ncbi:MAG: phosphomannomutase, partial [Deltaproteobacteria bacterium]|nr:phosphomannomutase [Deltaproteobacteria bacterium]